MSGQDIIGYDKSHGGRHCHPRMAIVLPPSLTYSLEEYKV